MLKKEEDLHWIQLVSTYISFEIDVFLWSSILWVVNYQQIFESDFCFGDHIAMKDLFCK